MAVNGMLSPPITDCKVPVSSFTRGYFWFAIARLAGVAARPLILLTALNLGHPDFATDFALVMTATLSSFVIYANQNHRALYNYFLDRSAPRKGLGGTQATLKYLDGVAIHIALFSPLVLALVWVWVEALWLIAMTMSLVLIEKYYDDHQRALVYKQSYQQWSLHFLFRLIVPSLVALFVMATTDSVRIEIYVGTVIVCFLLYISLFDRAFVRIVIRWSATLFGNAPARLKTRLKDYLKNYVTEFMGAQVFTVLAVNMLLIDRFFVKADFPSDFAAYIFAVNVFSMITVFHSIFHFTRVRNKLISQKCSVTRTFFSPRNIGVPFVLATGTLASFPILEAFGLFSQKIDRTLLLGLAAIHTVSAISLVLRELSFWRVKRHWLVFMDSLVIGVVCLTLICIERSLNVVPWIVAGGLIARAAVLSWLCATSNTSIRLPPTKILSETG